MGKISPQPSQMNARLLLGAAILTVVVWQLPFGRQILYPFTLLATYAHEMGHGLTALLVGAEFKELAMFSNGSGYARWQGNVGRIGRAMISAGGLVGPSIAGALLLVISKKTSRAPKILRVLGIFMLLSVLIWARSAFAIFFILLVACSFLFLARFEKPAAFFVQLLGVQLCLAVFSDLNYMFSEGGMVDGQQRSSDVAHIEQALWLPYWIWGGLVALTSFTVLGLGLRQALKPSSDSK